MTWSRLRPFSARLTACKRLHGEGSAKGTRHVELDLADSGIRYEPGDALGVFAPSSPATAGELLAATGLSADTPVTVGKETLPLGQALVEKLYLGRVSARFVRAVRAKLPAGPAAERLDAILADEVRREEYLSTRDYLDVVHEHPDAKLDAQELASAMNPITPRLYSIASSQRMSPRSVHLTVGVVEFEAHGRRRRGHVSGFLVERAVVGETLLPVYLQPTKHFRLPADPAADIIMIGPGTGIAPFRGFLDERRARGDTGKSWLFFGNQREACDFTYRDELEAHRAAGTLSRIDCAFSRDGEAKVYVQHKMRAAAGELWRWLSSGAYLYVCGDAHHMAKDVHEALVEIVSSEGGLSREAAEEHVSHVLAKDQKRYLKDCY